eukprot:CAMPEP_0119345434 /NCGR_PEP_ID=MMETSP1333-20130426/107484_1 /TAXON_ID=418940 /ORGANISM="Scyphosphaera apsteinii, Strain RCC1455" /LENGTH=153 /DNA_ID=CAMNT_0007357903 /DNA_START=93 /DNA_END=555 /DNA_ORIENTATION=-
MTDAKKANSSSILVSSIPFACSTAAEVTNYIALSAGSLPSISSFSAQISGTSCPSTTILAAILASIATSTSSTRHTQQQGKSRDTRRNDLLCLEEVPASSLTSAALATPTSIAFAPASNAALPPATTDLPLSTYLPPSTALPPSRGAAFTLMP